MSADRRDSSWSSQERLDRRPAVKRSCRQSTSHCRRHAFVGQHRQRRPASTVDAVSSRLGGRPGRIAARRLPASATVLNVVDRHRSRSAVFTASTTTSVSRRHPISAFTVARRRLVVASSHVAARLEQPDVHGGRRVGWLAWWQRQQQLWRKFRCYCLCVRRPVVFVCVSAADSVGRCSRSIATADGGRSTCDDGW